MAVYKEIQKEAGFCQPLIARDAALLASLIGASP